MESVFHNKHLNTFSHHIVMKCISCDKLPYYAGIVLVVELQKWELTNWYFLGFRQLNCWSKSEIEHVRRINRLCLLCFLCCRQNITYLFHFMLQNTFSTILPSPKESSSFFSLFTQLFVSLFMWTIEQNCECLPVWKCAPLSPYLNNIVSSPSLWRSTLHSTFKCKYFWFPARSNNIVQTSSFGV